MTSPTTVHRQSGLARLRLAALAACSALALLAGTAAYAAPTEITIPGDHVYPESITAASDGTLYIGSLGDGEIFRVPPGGSTAEPFIKQGSNGLLSVIGVLADEGTGTLWACSGDLSAAGVAVPTGQKPGGLKAFDLKTGAVKGSYPIPGARTLCNDMVVAHDGSLYVTDSFGAQILHLKKGAKELEVWIADPRFNVEGGAGLDGIAQDTDGTIYVNTYNGGGLFKVAMGSDGKAGAITTLEPNRKVALADALRFVAPHTFLMIEGTGSLDRVTVNGDKANLETIHDGFKLPVSVTLVGKNAWVLDGQLNHLFDAKSGKPSLPFAAHVVPNAIP